MKRFMTTVLLCLFAMFIFGCGGNDIVKNVKPQSEKQEYFSDFEQEKKFMLEEACKAVIKAGETPTSYYGDKCSFSKEANYSAFIGYLECSNGKLALVHIQYDMQDTAEQHRKLKRMSNEEIKKVPEEVISKIVTYKSIPNVYSSGATIMDNFLNRY